jgi:hypothetical protein
MLPKRRLGFSFLWKIKQAKFILCEDILSVPHPLYLASEPQVRTDVNRCILQHIDTSIGIRISSVPAML